MTAIQKHVHIVDMRGIGSVWGPGIGNHIANTGDLLPAGEDLRRICESVDASLLVLDPLSGAFGGNENDRTAVYDFVSDCRAWGDAAQCATLMIGHLPKGKEGKEAGFSGSTAWEASVRSLLNLSKNKLTDKSGTDQSGKESDEYWALDHMKSNYALLQPEVPLSKQSAGWWTQAGSKEEANDALEAYENNGTEKKGDNQQEENDEQPDANPNPYRDAFLQ